MSIDSFDQLFTQLSRDVYNAEKQHAKALPKLAKQATHPELQRAFEEHLEDTKAQIDRMEQVFEMLGERPKNKKCEAAEGLIMEAQEIMGEIDEEPLKDAAMIAAAQAMEHYEIARYGTLLTYAEMMGKPEVARLLHQSLKEEERADQLLNRLAEEEINEEAMRVDGSQVEASGRQGGGRAKGGGAGQLSKRQSSPSKGRQAGSGGRRKSVGKKSGNTRQQQRQMG